MEEPEWIRAVHAFMKIHENKSILTAHEKTELFNLHNLRVKTYFPTMEYGKSCSTCVTRVYKRIKDHWLKNIKPLEKTREEDETIDTI